MDAPPADRPRHRRPTMADVAQRVGVSRALVSLVFRGEPGASAQTRERVFQAAADLGYRPDTAARILARSRSNMLGVMLTVRNPFHADLVEEIYPAAEALGYDLVLSARAPGRDEVKAIEALLSHRCEALILLGPQISTAEISRLAERVPILVSGRRVPGAPLDVVRAADAKGVRQVVDHLVDLGHRDIVHVDGATGPGSPERRQGYRSGMRRHGLDQFVRVLPGDHTEESGAAAAHALLGEAAANGVSLPTAVVAANDRCAIGMLDVFNRAGVDVPGQVSLVGFDDSRVAHLSSLNLTTVRQDAVRMAELAVRAVTERLTTPDLPPRDLVLDSTLVVRGTTGRPRAVTTT